MTKSKLASEDFCLLNYSCLHEQFWDYPMPTIEHRRNKITGIFKCIYSSIHSLNTYFLSTDYGQVPDSILGHSSCPHRACIPPIIPLGIVFVTHELCTEAGRRCPDIKHPTVEIGTPKYSGHVESLPFSEEVCTLIITEVFPEHSGEFKCIAKNEAGTAVSTARPFVSPGNYSSGSPCSFLFNFEPRGRFSASTLTSDYIFQKEKK